MRESLASSINTLTVHFVLLVQVGVADKPPREALELLSTKCMMCQLSRSLPPRDVSSMMCFRKVPVIIVICHNLSLELLVSKVANEPAQLRDSFSPAPAR